MELSDQVVELKGTVSELEELREFEIKVKDKIDKYTGIIKNLEQEKNNSIYELEKEYNKIFTEEGKIDMLFGKRRRRRKFGKLESIEEEEIILVETNKNSSRSTLTIQTTFINEKTEEIKKVEGINTLVNDIKINIKEEVISHFENLVRIRTEYEQYIKNLKDISSTEDLRKNIVK